MISKYTLILFYLGMIIFSGCEKKGSDPINKTSVDSTPIPYVYSIGDIPIQVHVSFSKTTFSLLDSIILTISIHSGDEVSIRPFYLPEDTFAPMLLVHPPHHKKDWSSDHNTFIQTWQYKLEPLSSGDFKLKAFPVFFQLKKEKANAPDGWPIHKLLTAPIPYTVLQGTLSPDSKLRDIKGMIFPDFNAIPLLIVICILALTGGGLLWICYQKKKSIKPQQPQDYKSIALKHIEHLEKQSHVTPEELKILHTRLSDIIRTYIENTFCIKSHEQTTEEFIQHITHNNYFTGATSKNLKNFLNLTDLVKFAGFSPEQDLCKTTFQQAKDIINHTEKEKKNGI